VRLPETVTTPRLILRRWLVDDAAVLSGAVAESLDHLRPWMSWTADEPLATAARIAVLEGFQTSWEAGTEVVYGAFLRPGSAGDGSGGPVVGGCGLVDRPERATLEIGYWVHVDHRRRGFATEMAAALTDAAFTLDAVEAVEIHHARANRRSRAVPSRLGFRWGGERPDQVAAPAEEGVDCTWIMDRADWVSRS